VMLPFMAGIVLFAMTAIKYYTLFTMNKQAWITRREDRGIVEGQSAGTLGGPITAAEPVLAEASEGID
jgi:hypothetical protein